MIVIDTNILVYLSWRQSEARLNQEADQVIKKDSRVLVPALWRHEFLNALSQSVKHGVLDLNQASRLWAEALALYESCEAPVDLWRAFELAQLLGLSTYDAQFVALAEHANAFLITEDRRLRHAVGNRALSMKEYLAA